MKQEELSKVDLLIKELCDRNFFNKEAREEMLKMFHILLREQDPEQKQKVRRLFRSVSNYLSDYGKQQGISESIKLNEMKETSIYVELEVTNARDAMSELEKFGSNPWVKQSISAEEIFDFITDVTEVKNRGSVLSCWISTRLSPKDWHDAVDELISYLEDKNFRRVVDVGSELKETTMKKIKKNYVSLYEDARSDLKKEVVELLSKKVGHAAAMKIADGFSDMEVEEIFKNVKKAQSSVVQNPNKNAYGESAQMLKEGFGFDEKKILQHYLIAALWSSHDDNGDSFDSKFDISDFSNDDRRKAQMDIKKFISKASRFLAQIDRSVYDEENIGHDFWLTRNGHGAGFWDRSELPEGIGEALTKIATSFGESDVYTGDDGKVYLG